MWFRFKIAKPILKGVRLRHRRVFLITCDKEGRPRNRQNQEYSLKDTLEQLPLADQRVLSEAYKFRRLREFFVPLRPMARLLLHAYKAGFKTACSGPTSCVRNRVLYRLFGAMCTGSLRAKGRPEVPALVPIDWRTLRRLTKLCFLWGIKEAKKLYVV